MKITLIGYMGSGKTTIGKMLSKKLNINFFDLDSLIMKKHKDSILNIFNKKGEYFFRKEENLTLRKFIKKTKQYILSVGGGTPCYFNNIYLLNKYSITFYLKSDCYTLFKRLFSENQTRPLIYHLNKNELFQFIMKNLYKRIDFYEKSHETINIVKKSKKEIIYNIFNIIQNNYSS
ncbi:shikimate kinase [Blattabacterium cuenoti]|uniref:shikimate kinase n=1 Tax=Blattabacterium cuenoti TaxID=1653831 RepID=UPI00163C09C2|nr:shikimate kinase [Blattabacterium cuenoti]